MERARVKDWLIGAAGMTLVLLIGVGIFWWLVSDPTAGREARPVSPPSVSAQRTPGRERPADMRKDQVWFSDLSLEAGTVVTSGSILRHVRAVGHDVVTRPDGLVAARVSVDATVPFGVVANELGHDAVVRAAHGGQVTVARTVETLGRRLDIVATGTVEVRAGRLVVEPRSIDIGGPKILAEATAAVVRRFVTIQYHVEGLPKGLLLQDVTVQGDGFRAKLRGTDVKLRP